MAPDLPDAAVRQRRLRRAFTAGWLVAFTLAARFIGFGAATLVFVPVYLIASGLRSPIWIAAIALFAVGALTLIFGEIAGVPIWESHL